MGLPFELGLRHGRHMVSVTRGEVEGRQQLVLGKAYRADSSPRLRILEQWGMEQGSPRKPMLETVDEPLSLRHKVAYAAKLSPDIQQALHSGFDGAPVGRREKVKGVKGRLHVGPTHEPLTNGQPPLRGGSMVSAMSSMTPMRGRK